MKVKIAGLILAVMAVSVVGCKSESKNKLIGGAPVPPAAQESSTFYTGTWTGTLTGTDTKTNTTVAIPVTAVLTQGGASGRGRGLHGLIGTFATSRFIAPLINSAVQGGIGYVQVVSDSVNNPGGCFASVVLETRSEADPNKAAVTGSFIDCQVVVQNVNGTISR